MRWIMAIPLFYEIPRTNRDNLHRAIFGRTNLLQTHEKYGAHIADILIYEHRLVLQEV